MSFKAVAWVVNNYDRSAGAPTCMQYKAMVALAEWADDDYICFPSIKSIAYRLNRDTRQTQRVIRELADRGDVLVIKPTTQGRGQYNRYLVHCDQYMMDMADSLAGHERLEGMVPDSKAAAKELVIKRQATVDRGKKKQPRPKPKEYTPQKKAELLLGGINGDAPQRIDYLRKELDRSDWNIKNTEIETLVCELRYATNWPLPTTPGERAIWRKALNEHLETYGDSALISKLYAASYTRLKQQQQDARDNGRALTLSPRPSTLTKTMAGINQEWKDKNAQRSNSVDVEATLLAAID
jgi:hypothetical protein